MEKENLKEEDNQLDKNKIKNLKFDKVDKEYEQKLIEVSRITRVTEGGKRLRFRACVIVGNKKGKVGVGVAKSSDVALAVDKAFLQAKKNLTDVSFSSYTIPCEVISKFGAAKVMLKPATEGTNIVAGGPIRSLLELAGVQNVVVKLLGSTKNKITNIQAAMNGLKELKYYEDLRNEKFASKQKQSEKDK